MSVLPLEPYFHPEDLFDPTIAAHSVNTSLESCPWSVLHTRPRTEKSLARVLHRQGVTFFLPLYERKQRIQRRLVRSYLPLFPSYLFMRGDDGARTMALETNLLVGTLQVADQERLETDLARIFKLIQAGAPLTPEERLEPGMAAEITGGPLAGQRGRVVRRGSSMRLIIEVDFLQQGASVEVDSTQIRAV